jgi:hypothetical protein
MRIHPNPSQCRMCRFPASGSSWKSFAREGVAMDDPGCRQRATPLGAQRTGFWGTDSYGPVATAISARSSRPDGRTSLFVERCPLCRSRHSGPGASGFLAAWAIQSVIAKGDCRKSFGKSLCLVVRGGSARWEYQYRPKGSKTVKAIWLGSAIGDNKVSLMDVVPH